MDAEEFYKNTKKLFELFENRGLEEYLLALLKIIEENKSKTLSYELLIDMIQNAFVAEPLEFKEEWLKYESAPDENKLSKKFTNPEISQSIDKSNFLLGLIY